MNTRWVWGSVVLGAALGIGWWMAEPSEPRMEPARSTAAVNPAHATEPRVDGAVGASPTAQVPYSAAGLQARQEQLALWRGRLERAEQLYASYRDSTRYPFESRPISEHPDQVRPFAPIEEELVLRGVQGEPLAGLRLRTSQERVFASGADSIKFTVEAVDDRGRSLPLSIRQASAQSVADSRTPVRIIQAPVPFADEGGLTDDVAGDNRFSARLTPATQGFASYNGTIRVLAEIAANGQQGVAQFDVVYAPEVPATWLGVREALEHGSLNFYLKANVRKGGRYVVSARVDDAQGRPFALLQYNDEVAPGPREFRLQVFGALVLDRNPTFPLQLRDVEGFLLIPDTFPDRALMPRQNGVVHASQRYARDRFSSAEWTSEERERYLAEYAKDAEEAKRKLQEMQGR